MHNTDADPEPTNKPLSPAACRNWMFLGLILLGFGWWVRYSLGVDWVFWYAALFGAGIGVMFAGWLKDVY